MGLVVVTGLPRSRTSLIMRMLELGGIEILQTITEKSKDYPYGKYEYRPEYKYCIEDNNKAIKRLSLGRLKRNKEDTDFYIIVKRDYFERNILTISKEEYDKQFNELLEEIKSSGKNYIVIESIDAINNPEKVVKEIGKFINIDLLNAVKAVEIIKKEVNNGRF